MTSLNEARSAIQTAIGSEVGEGPLAEALRLLLGAIGSTLVTASANRAILSYSATTDNATQPAIGASTSFPVGNSSPYTIGQKVYGIGGGVYLVTSIPDATHVGLQNTGAAGNAAPGTVLASGTIVTNPVFEPEMFGAKGDGTTNDGPAFALALAAIAAIGFGTLFLRATSYNLPTGTLLVPTQTSIVGHERASIVLRTSTGDDQAIFRSNGTKISISGVTAVGDNPSNNIGTKQNQFLFQNGDPLVVDSGFSDVSMEFCEAYGMQGGLFRVAQTSSPSDGGRIVGCYADSCGGNAFWADVRGEYMILADCTAVRGNTGLRIDGGNFVGGECNISRNRVGITLPAGLNDSHGRFIGGEVNHNALNGIVIGAVTSGFMFVGTDLFDNGTAVAGQEAIICTNSQGILWLGGEMDNQAYSFTDTNGGLAVIFYRPGMKFSNPNLTRYSLNGGGWVDWSDGFSGPNFSLTNRCPSPNFNRRGIYCKRTLSGDVTFNAATIAAGTRIPFDVAAANDIMGFNATAVPVTFPIPIWQGGSSSFLIFAYGNGKTRIAEYLPLSFTVGADIPKLNAELWVNGVFYKNLPVVPTGATTASVQVDQWIASQYNTDWFVRLIGNAAIAGTVTVLHADATGGARVESEGN